jgi:predicted metalloprotease
MTVAPAADQAGRLAQADDSLAAAGEAAREFSRLEAAGDFTSLYDRMHPAARAVVPRSAVVGWYEAFYATRETSEATITGVVPAAWTWEVTGVAYADAVTVHFIQPYIVDGVTSEVAGDVHLVPYGEGQWGWFFGASRDFVEAQIALYGDDGSTSAVALAQESEYADSGKTETLFPDPLPADINRFWVARFAEAGRAYDPPHGFIGFDHPVRTPCGRADPDQEAVFYCVSDETIYYSTTFRSVIETGIGDFAWAIVVAHEWGHHIQHLLGIELGAAPDRAGAQTPFELEQQADCLAGAYAIDAQRMGSLAAGDMSEAFTMIALSGDPSGVAWNDPRAHGTSDQRTDAFLNGYADGVAGCHLSLAP